jgi:transcriptional regulator with XRE-family HTH domain
MVLLRQLLGEALRHARLRQQRTLREVSAAARVSLGYLSEVERGQKEASSELLSSICDALDVRLADLLREVSDSLDLAELTRAAERPRVSVREPLVVTTGFRSEPVGASVPVGPHASLGAPAAMAGHGPVGVPAPMVTVVPGAVSDHAPALASPVTYAA